MQTLKKFYFGKQKAKVNTFIGGIGGTINTPALLAAKLGISENRIKLFKVTGVDVECAITKGSQFDYNFNERVGLIGITYYYDNDGYVKNIASSGIGGGANFFKGYFPGIINQIGTRVFQDRPIGYRIEMPNCISLPNFFTGNYSGVTGKVLVVPKCTSFGTDKLNNSVFTSGGGAQGLKVYAPISEQTSNSGSVEGDLNYVLSVGSSVVYVANFTPPNPVTNLSTGTIYNTAVQLNFTPPTSVNGVDFYEVYINGERFNSKEIKNSGEFITGLTPSTNYNIRIVAVDMFYNKSELSNTVNVSTVNEQSLQGKAISYFRLDNSTIDQKGLFSGIPNNITYSNGVSGNSAVFNGTTSKIDLNNIALSQGTISCWIKTSNAGTSYRGIVVKQFAFGIFLNSNRVSLYDWGTSTVRATSVFVNNNTWRHLVVTFENGVTNGTKVYIDGTLTLTTTITIANQGSNVQIGNGGASSTNQYFAGSIDSIGIFESVLTDLEVLSLRDIGLSGNEFI